jgi:hypothetical protein
MGSQAIYIRYEGHQIAAWDIELFLLTAEASKTKASGAGPQECLHKLHQIISYNGFWKDSFRFSDFDLSHKRSLNSA